MRTDPIQGKMIKPRLGTWVFSELVSEDTHCELWCCRHPLQPGEFFAKRLVGVEDHLRVKFEREAYLASHLPSNHIVPLVDSDLNASKPILVRPELQLMTLREWTLQQAMPPSQTVLVWIARQAIVALHSLHQLGYVHGCLTPDCLLLDMRSAVRLGGLWHCRPVGSHLAGVDVAGIESSNAYCPPEFEPTANGGADVELSSASDIYAIARVLSELIGRSFEKSPLAEQMLAEAPEDRPTCGELLPIFLDLEQSLFGRQIAA